ncbi:Homeobox domain [Macleaya cordata]|uniref:Homeobox domain n=1 Tax=Macleaya cordata TaxID=56857 RepID=A0A200PXG3_MACCD|nr:Homeobox domain [Macleaya cordata]
MYGDCQVLSSMGGNIVTTDALFSSPIRNPNLNFMTNMPFHPFSAIIPKEESGLQMILGKEEEMESGSGSGHVDGGASADEQENEQKPKKKRYHRHTARQIQEMEALFKECPHPDDKQRMRLSQELGLKPRQVKFWFQNRRTQMKAQQDRSDNVILRAENENLKNENYRLQAAIRNVICPNCGGPAILGEMSLDEQHLRLENARLKEELERLSCITQRYSVRQIQAMGHAPHLLPSLDLDMGIYSRHFQEPMGTDIIPMPNMSENQHDLQLAGCCLILDQEKPLAMELAMSAMDELVKMCQATEPLWVLCNNGNKEVLNVEEHSRMFPWPANLKQHENEFRTEATRDSAVVIMNSITLVDAFLDANKWMELFPSIVARAKTVQIITSGVSGHASGSLHLMHAELQFPSPLVPTREAHFLRYCQQNVEEGTWAIVDFPIDSIHDSPQVTSLLTYRRRPSGCIIQDMPNGYSRVIWVEHAEVEDKPVHHIFNQFVSSGMAFRAQRWLSVLQQQCERFASLMARNISDLGVIPSPEARRNLMKLSQRMIRTFCFNISASGGQSWTALSDSSVDTVRITTRKNIEPGQPNGVILCAVSTTWLPFSHHQVFDFLRDERQRSQLDVLSGGTSSHEVAHIANGSHPGNCISLLRINAASNSAQNVELMLQESCTDNAGSMVVYTTIDVDAVQLAMSGEDPSYIPILPLGFVMVPVNHINNENGGNGLPSDEVNGPTSGCLLTVGLQVLASTIPAAKLNLSSVTAINNHICNVVHQINAVLSGSSSSNNNSPVGGNAGGGSCGEPTTASEQ